MLENLMFRFAQTGVWGLLAALALLVLTPLFLRRYRASALRWMWIILAVRMLIPAIVPERAPLLLPVPVQVTQAVKDTQTLPEKDSDTSRLLPDEPSPAQNEETGRAPAGFIQKPVKIVAAIWMSAACLMFLTETCRYFVWRRRVMRWNRMPSARLCTETESAAAGLGIRKIPDVRENEVVRTPMTIGWLRPVLLIPASFADEEKRAFLRPVILHELTHYRRRDTLLRFVMLIVRCIHWYNPAAWILERQFERSAELACDETVLALDVSRRAYADALMSVVRSAEGRCVIPTTCFASEKRFVRQRFSALFSAAPKQKGRAAVLLLCFALLGTVLVACVPTASAASESSALAAEEAGPVRPEKGPEPAAGLSEETTSLDGVYTTQKIYPYMGASLTGNAADAVGGIYDSETGTYQAVAMPETDGIVDVPMLGGAWKGTERVMLCVPQKDSPFNAEFFASSDGGATYIAEQRTFYSPDGEKLSVIGMQNVSEKLCLLLATDSENRFWLLRCETDESGLPVSETSQALPVPVKKEEGRVRMSFVNEQVGFIIDKYRDDEAALPLVLWTTDGGQTWSQMDFADVLADCPFERFYPCCIFTVGSRTEIRCFTSPGITSFEWIALVSDDFGQTWDWYPRVPDGESGVLRMEQDKAAGLDKIRSMIYPDSVSDEWFAENGASREEYERIVEFIETDGQPETLYFRF